MKTIKLIYIVLLVICNSSFVYGQENTTINTSSKCIQISRTSTDWQELIAFPVPRFTIPANTTKYLHMMVLYPAQPDIAIRVDGADENSDGNSTSEIRPLNSYTDFGKWGTLVFPLEAENNDMQVDAILIFPDAGFQNQPPGQVLDDSGTFGYIDEIILKDNFTLANGNDLELNNNHVAVYPNPTQETFKIEATKTIAKVSLFDNSGKELIKNMHTLNINEYDIGGLSSGLYFIHIFDNKGGVEVKRLLKQ